MAEMWSNGRRRLVQNMDAIAPPEDCTAENASQNRARPSEAVGGARSRTPVRRRPPTAGSRRDRPVMGCVLAADIGAEAAFFGEGTKLLQRRGLDLTHALARQIEGLAHLFERLPGTPSSMPNLSLRSCCSRGARCSSRARACVCILLFAMCSSGAGDRGPPRDRRAGRCRSRRRQAPRAEAARAPDRGWP